MSHSSPISVPASAATPRSAIDTLAQNASPFERARAAAQHDFASILSESIAARSGAAVKPRAQMTEPEKEQQARRLAQDFVAVAFIQPILKQLRSSPMGDLAPPLGPGPGEKQFRTLADTHMAHQLARATNWPLVDQLTRSLRKHHKDPFSKAALASAPTQPGSPADVRAAAERRAKADPPAPADAPDREPASFQPAGLKLNLLK